MSSSSTGSDVRVHQVDHQQVDLSRTSARRTTSSSASSDEIGRQFRARMLSADKCLTQMINLIIQKNVYQKVNLYLKEFPDYDERQELKMIVYGDKEEVTQLMWRSIFRSDLRIVHSTLFPPIPIPVYYTPECYEEYEQELRKHVASCVESNNLIWGLYNLAAPEHDPRMHLVLANRRVKRSELGRWAQTDKSRRQGSPSRPSSFRERSELSQPFSGEYTNSGMVSFFAESAGASLRGLSLPNGGESAGMESSSIVYCDNELSRYFLRAYLGEDTGSGITCIEGSIEGSSAEDRSSGGSSARFSLENDGAHQDPRFISIESLRGLVSNLPYVSPVSSIPGVSSATSSSSSTSSDVRVRQLAQPLYLSRTSASGAERDSWTLYRNFS